MHIARFYNVLLLQAILEFVIESPEHDLFKSLFLITVLVKQRKDGGLHAYFTL